MVIVLLILVALAGLVVPQLGQFTDRGELAATNASLESLRNAMLDGYYNDVGELPVFVTDLLVRPAGVLEYNPTTRRGWNGPYVRHGGARYEANPAGNFTLMYVPGGGAPVVTDGWSSPIVLQPGYDPSGTPTTDELRGDYLRFVSAGPNGVLDTPPTLHWPSIGASGQCGDDLVLYLRLADIRPQVD